MANDDTARFLISGTVQGVFFRASTRTQARRLGLSGFVRNLDDGRVEVLASGDSGSIEALAAWLRSGPPHAVVTGVERSAADASDLPGTFEVRD